MPAFKTPDFKTLAAYPVIVSEKVRISDTDRQGHVNNVAFSFFYEAGRAGIIMLDTGELLDPGCFFVIVTTTIDFTGELHYPGVIDVASGIERIGSSSFMVRQALFQNGRCASISNSTMVQVNIATKTAQPLSQKARQHFGSVMMDAGG